MCIKCLVDASRGSDQCGCLPMEVGCCVRAGGVGTAVGSPAKAGVWASKVSVTEGVPWGRAGNPSSHTLPDQDRSERGQGPGGCREEQGAEVLTPPQAGERERREEVGASGRRWEWRPLCDAGPTSTLRPHSMTFFVFLSRISR